MLGKLTLLESPRTHTNCLIIGGSGGLGLLTGLWLVSLGSSQVTLASRSGRAKHKTEFEMLNQVSCANVTVAACDATDLFALKGMLGQVTDLSGIIHCSAVFTPGLIEVQTQKQLQMQIRSKPVCLHQLHKLAQPSALTDFVAFSSLAAVVGLKGEAVYAAANGALDSLVAWRRSLSLRSLSLQWGTWSQVGAGARAGTDKALFGETKLYAVLGVCTPSIGMRALNSALHLTAPILTVTPLHANPSSVLPATRDMVRGLVSRWRLSEQKSGELQSEQPQASSLCGISLAAFKGVVVARIEEFCGSVLSDHEHWIDAVDSLAAIELRSLLSDFLGVQIEVQMFYEHQTLGGLIGHLHSLVASETIALPVPQIDLYVGQSKLSRGICVAGMACRLAGHICSVSDFWDVLWKEKIFTTRTPPQRWLELCAESKAPEIVEHGAFIDCLDDLQNLLPNSDPAMVVDPHLQALLTVVRAAFLDAKWSEESLKRRSIGIFTAANTENFVVPTASFIVSRTVSASLCVDGVHQNVEAACSSGYIAIHNALDSLRFGRSSMTAIGGAQLLLNPGFYIRSQEYGFLSPSARMRPLDDSSDGMVAGKPPAQLLF